MSRWRCGGALQLGAGLRLAPKGSGVTQLSHSDGVAGDELCEHLWPAIH